MRMRDEAGGGAAVPPAGAPGLSAAARGILIMLLGILVFTLMDALAKHLSATYPTMQVVWARYAGQTVLVLVLLAPKLGSVIRSGSPGLQALRSVFQFGATSLFFLSLSFIGLAEATAIMDVNPVLITLGAALFLGERIGPRRMAGVLVSLAGALIIVRPGSGVFSVAALLPLAAAFCYAGFAVLTRLTSATESAATSMLYAALLGTAVTTAMLPWIWQPVAWGDLWGFVLIGAMGAAGQLCLVRAFTLAEAGVIAPFGYSGLIFATLWGYVFFGALPDLWTVVGALVIVGAGLYVWHREAQVARAGRR